MIKWIQWIRYQKWVVGRWVWTRSVRPWFLNSFTKLYISSCLVTCWCCCSFDLIYDAVGNEEIANNAETLLRPFTGATYVTIVIPLVRNTDANGIVCGLAKSACQLSTSVAKVWRVMMCKYLMCICKLNLLVLSFSCQCQCWDSLMCVEWDVKPYLIVIDS